MSIKINLYKGEPFVLRSGHGQPIPTVLAVPEVDGVELHDCAASANDQNIAINNALEDLCELIKIEGVVDKREDVERAVER
jgi:hypothetical protein